MRTAAQAVAAALATETNEVGMCQKVTRGYYQADSAGDVDHDGDQDAVDGWESEPESARHPGDTNPPAGAPVSYGVRNGHRGISLGDGKIRSTDAPTEGVTSTVDLMWPVEHWGHTYLGWSETIDGEPIPGLKKIGQPVLLPPDPPKKPKKTKVSQARAKLESALARARRRGYQARVDEIQKALDALPKR